MVCSAQKVKVAVKSSKIGASSHVTNSILKNAAKWLVYASPVTFLEGKFNLGLKQLKEFSGRNELTNLGPTTDPIPIPIFITIVCCSLLAVCVYMCSPLPKPTPQCLGPCDDVCQISKILCLQIGFGATR